MQTICIRIDDNIDGYISDIAKYEQRSKSSMIRKILQDFVFSREQREYLLDCKAADEAHERWLADGKKTYSLEELAREDGVSLEG
ncbi:hypothetical protein FACS1894152_7990 [Bacilli bacterium]|nr:hypothetical protein FACS1894152_7990 [Bacilli bacterium]